MSKRSRGILCIVLAMTIFILITPVSCSTYKIRKGDAVDVTSKQNISGDTYKTSQSQTYSYENITQSLIDDNKTDSETTNIVFIDEASDSKHVLVDQDGIIISTTGMVDDTLWGKALELVLTNNTDKSLTVVTEAVIVNNFMASDRFICHIAPYETTSDLLYPSSSALAAKGIDNIGQIEIYFSVTDDSTYQLLSSPECVIIRTNEYVIMDEESKYSGKELFNQDGFRIEAIYIEEGSYWSGTDLLFYIENTSGKNVQVYFDKITANNCNEYWDSWSTVYNDKMDMYPVSGFMLYLKENKIEHFESIGLEIRIFDIDSMSLLVESGPIVCKLN